MLLKIVIFFDHIFVPGKTSIFTCFLVGWVNFSFLCPSRATRYTNQDAVWHGEIDLSVPHFNLFGVHGYG